MDSCTWIAGSTFFYQTTQKASVSAMGDGGPWIAGNDQRLFFDSSITNENRRSNS
jgi:hypothetical protein